MMPDPIDRVFGRGRLKMATGPHVEVFREAAAPGESRRYTKRFLTTADGDYAEWTEREWRILARLIGHGSRSVPDVVQYDRDAHGTKLVQTYDAGATVDQWATLLPVERNGRVHAHVFEDCAHWWALAHHSLAALDEIHTLGLVHLDVKGDNVCIPIGPANFDPGEPGQRMHPVFRKLALIDFAFSLVSGETLATPLPIGWQQDYDYQSPRLLQALEAGRAGDLRPTENLDWRCDMYSLAAMLKRYLPRDQVLYEPGGTNGWTPQRYDAAKALILRIREAHDGELTAPPHVELMLDTSAQLRSDELARSLDEGWTLARNVQPRAVAALPLTPVTRLAPPVRIVMPADDEREPTIIAPWRVEPLRTSVPPPRAHRRQPGLAVVAGVAIVAAIVAAAAANGWIGSDTLQRVSDAMRSVAAPARTPHPTHATVSKDVDDAVPAAEPTAEIASTKGEVEPEPSPAPSEPAAARATANDVVPPATLGAPASAPPAAKTGESFAQQIEAYRAKPAARTTRDARAPATATHRAPTRSSESVKRAPTSSAARNARSTPPAPARVVAARRSDRTATAAAKNVPATLAASIAAASTTTPALPAETSVTVLSVERADTSTHPAAVATDVAPSSQVESRVAPTPESAVARAPAETARAQAPRAAAPGLAPIIDASRALPPRTLAAARQEPPRDTPEAAREPPRDVREVEREPARPIETVHDEALIRHARWLLSDSLPRSASQAQARVAHVLAMAAFAQYPAQEAALARAASSVASGGLLALSPAGTRQDARRLHDRARHTYHSLRHVPEAFDLALAAFAADPNDADVAGHLAFLHLKLLPAQPERARQLALHAIGTRNPGDAARVNDWTTFAIASALTGRAAEARHAWFTVLAVSRDVEQSCRSALAALAVHGERLREPVEALLHRLRAQGRSDDVAACARPIERMASAGRL